MSEVEQLGGSMVNLIVEISPEKFEEGIKTAYQKNKNRITVPGFRRGKAPLKMVEQVYGKGIFYEDALNEVLPDVYQQAVAEQKLEVMSRPDVNVDTIEDGKPVKVTMKVAVKPEVTLGEYKGLKKKTPSTQVTDQDVEDEIQRTARQNARMNPVEDRPSQEGDTVTIDYEGFVDGKPFEGGKAEGSDLKLGSHTFIDTFEDQLTGKNAGDDVEVHVTFPAEYHEKSLAGKPAVFHVKIKGIKTEEIPEINDDFVKDVSSFDNVEDYRKDVREKLEKRKADAADTEVKNKLIDEAVSGASMDMPDPMVQEECLQMLNEYAQTLSYQGISFDQYMKYTGTNMDSLMKSVRPEAEKRLKENLVLEAIAKAENLEVTDEDLDKELSDMAKNYNMDLEKLKASVTDEEKKNIKAELLSRKAVSFLVDNAVESDDADEAKEEAPKAEEDKAQAAEPSDKA